MKVFLVFVGLIFSVFGLSALLFAAAPASDPSMLISKLERAEQNHQEILKQLAIIKEELQVVKIRASSKAIKKT